MPQVCRRAMMESSLETTLRDTSWWQVIVSHRCECGDFSFGPDMSSSCSEPLRRHFSKWRKKIFLSSAGWKDGSWVKNNTTNQAWWYMLFSQHWGGQRQTDLWSLRPARAIYVRFYLKKERKKSAYCSCSSQHAHQAVHSCL